MTFEDFVDDNIDNADLATLVAWKERLSKTETDKIKEIIRKINKRVKELIERSTYNYQWLTTAPYEDFIKLTENLEGNVKTKFLKRTYGNKFKEEYIRQEGLRKGDNINPLRLSYYSPEKRKLYLEKTETKIDKLTEVPYRNRLIIRSSARAYEEAKYEINKLFFSSDNKWYGKYENQLQKEGQLLLDKLKGDFNERKQYLTYRLENDYYDFMNGKKTTYVNIHNFEKMYKKTIDADLVDDILHPVDNRGYQKWKQWIKSAQATYASYPVWNNPYQTRTKKEGDEYIVDGENLFDLLEENVEQIKNKKEGSLDELLKVNKELVDKIDVITRKIQKRKQEAKEEERKRKQEDIEEDIEEKTVEEKTSDEESEEESEEEAEKETEEESEESSEEESEESSEEEAEKETQEVIQESQTNFDEDEIFPLQSVTKDSAIDQDDEEELEEVGRLKKVEEGEDKGWWVITELGEEINWKQIIGDEIEQDVLKEYAKAIVKANDLDIIEKMVSSIKKVNIPTDENTLKEMAKKQKLKDFGVDARNKPDSIKKALLLQALLNKDDDDNEEDDDQNTANLPNKEAVVLKPESDFSDFDYDEFTDEEYGEWKDSSDTGSYMSD